MRRKLMRVLIVGLLLALILVTLPLSMRHTAVAAPSFIGHPACAGVSLENPATPECDALMASRTAPSFPRVPVDLGIASDLSFMRFNTEDVDIYSAPGGSVVETMHVGYSYVSPSSWGNGWAEISPGRWVDMANTSWSRPSDFSGVLINSGLDMPFAWVLWQLDASETPAGNSDRETGHYSRFQMVWIYATVNVSGWDWHLVGPGHWISQKNLSIVYPTAPAEYGGNWVGVNVYEQNLVTYSGGTPVMATLVSSGVKNGLWNTRLGTFDVDERVVDGTMNGAEGGPDFYSLEHVPYAQYFDGLISLHGTYWHDSFGFPHSHGCVNLTVSDAKWLFDLLNTGSTVYVYDAKY
jgi:hypothetical protein